MEIFLNKIQCGKAITHFFKNSTIIDFGYGDIYINTKDNTIVFMGVEHPHVFPLENSGFELDTEDFPYTLQAIVLSSDYDIYGRVIVIDNIGNEIKHFKYDMWKDDNIRVITKLRLAQDGVTYDDITFHFF